PIAVGQAEAHAIITALQGVEPQRPMTHDLMTNIMMTLHASIERVDIHSYYDETFHAALTMVQNGVTFIVDARPSDAVALAVRQKVPIYLDQDVFNASSIETSAMSGRPDDMSIDKRDSRMEKVLTQIHNFSEHVQPDDFKL
ncbi:MAG: bifunctional nuclease family protein, partial [Coriobacteriia bacterium]|nr:bifunctional nuclease family protein [Coriobacteriia bacterium]